MNYVLVLDVIIAVLLVATIVYAVMLNRRLSVLRRNGEEMARLISRFNEATMRAESSIPQLRRTAEDAGEALQERVERAQALRDDLAFMIERADAMADRLEKSVRSARNEAKAVPRSVRPVSLGALAQAGEEGPGPGGGSADMALDDERSEAERELLRALQQAR